MPVIQMATSRLTPEMKNKLIHRLTEVSSEITGTPAKFFAVVISEYDDENLGFAGESVVELKAGLKKDSSR